MTLLSGLLWTAFKATLLLGASMILVSLLRSRSAAVRHHFLACGIAGALLMPIDHYIRVGWSVPAPLSDRVLHIPRVRTPVLSSNGATALSATSRAGQSTIEWRALAGSAWLTGSLLLLSLLCWNLHRSRSVAKAGQELVSDGSWSGRVRVVSSRSCSTPFTVGLWRPVIVLPKDAESWNRTELRAVLAHEAAHACRRDPAFHALAEVACALYWWHPLVWLAAKRLRLEAEIAADDAVLSTGVLPDDYATQLLRWAELAHVAPLASPQAIPTAISALSTRIRSLIANDTNRTPPTVALKVLSVMGASLTVLVLATAHVAPREAKTALARQPANAAIRDSWREAGSEFEITIEGNVIPGSSLENTELSDGSRLYLSERPKVGWSREIEIRRILGVIVRTWCVDGTTRPLTQEAREWAEPMLRNTSRLVAVARERRTLARERAKVVRDFLPIPSRRFDRGTTAHELRLRHKIEKLAQKRNELILDPENRRGHAQQLGAERSAIEIERQELTLLCNLAASLRTGSR